MVWHQFNEFFIRLDVKPTSWEDRLILFVGYLVENNKKSLTIRSYISAVKSVLREDNVIVNEDRYLLTSLTKACKYKNDQVRIRLPIQKGILNMLFDELLDILDQQPYLMTLYRAMFASAYYGLLRVGEIASGEHPVKAVDVHVGLNKRKIMFMLRTLKTHWKDVKPQVVKVTSMSNHASN